MNDKIVSYCVFSYNQEHYIKEAVESVLLQVYPQLEIIISDDCSTDSTFQIIEEITRSYEGPHTILLNRNEKNMGVAAHCSKIYYSCAGSLIIGLGGDDIAEPHHAKTAIALMEENPDISIVDFSGYTIDKNGAIKNKIQPPFHQKKFFLRDYLAFDKIASFAPGRIIRSTLLTDFGPISENCPTEDSVLVFRSMLKGGLLRVNDSLVFYRRHEENLSGNTANMSNFAIIAQYIADLLYLFDHHQISEKRSNLILKRLMVEYDLRILRFSKSQNNFGKFLKVIQYKISFAYHKFIFKKYFKKLD